MEKLQDISWLTTLQSPLFAVNLPILHYLLLKTFSPLTATLLILPFLVIIPVIRQVPEVGLNPVACALFVGIFFKTVDAAMLDQEIINSLTFYDYLKYFVIYKVPKTFRVGYHARVDDRFTIPLQNLYKFKFWSSFMISSTFKLAFCFAVIFHLDQNRPDWNPSKYSISSFNDLLSARDNYLLALTIMFLLECSGSFANAFSALIFKEDFAPMMRQPYFATSVREFWVNWNLIVQRGLRRIVFEPILYCLGYGSQTRGEKKIPALVISVAAIATFAFSGLFHEWMVLAICNEGPSGEQMLFFLSQSLICVVEILVIKFVKISFGVNIGKSVPFIFQIIYVQTILIIFGPLFTSSYIRDKVFQSMFGIDLIKSYF